jgi:hypothetical protein
MKQQTQEKQEQQGEYTIPIKTFDGQSNQPIKRADKTNKSSNNIGPPDMPKRRTSDDSISRVVNDDDGDDNFASNSHNQNERLQRTSPPPGQTRGGGGGGGEKKYEDNKILSSSSLGVGPSNLEFPGSLRELPYETNPKTPSTLPEGYTSA